MMKQGAAASPVKATNQMIGMKRFGSIGASSTMRKRSNLKEVAPAPSDSFHECTSALLSRKSRFNTENMSDMGKSTAEGSSHIANLKRISRTRTRNFNNVSQLP